MTEPVPPTERADPLPHQQRRARRPLGADAPLRRSREHRVLAGVCAGIASFVGASPWTVRWLWIVSLPPSLGLTALAYPALWWLLPLRDAPTPATRAEGP